MIRLLAMQALGEGQEVMPQLVVSTIIYKQFSGKISNDLVFDYHVYLSQPAPV